MSKTPKPAKKTIQRSRAPKKAPKKRLRTLPLAASAKTVERALARKLNGTACGPAVGKRAPAGRKKRTPSSLTRRERGAARVIRKDRPVVLEEKIESLSEERNATGLRSRKVTKEESERQALRKEALLLAAESGLNVRTALRWLLGEPRDGRKSVYGTTHKLLSEVAARLKIVRRGAIPVRGGPQAAPVDPVDRDVRRLSEATDFQPRTVRRWLLGEGTVQAVTARQLANKALELGIARPPLPLDVASSLGHREADQ
jgi:hypothetical protein